MSSYPVSDYNGHPDEPVMPDEPERCANCAHANHEDGEAGVIYCTNRLSFFHGKPMPGTGAWCEKWSQSE
jgi:hypothetical protein